MKTSLKRMRTSVHIPRNRTKRPKTFTSVNSAKIYAEAQNLKNYKLVSVATSKFREKTKIVLE